MILKSISFEKVNWTGESGTKYDIDRYIVEMRSSLSTHEYVLDVDHINKSVSGDVIRYGSWDDLEVEEVVEILEMVESEGKLKRPFRDYVQI